MAEPSKEQLVVAVSSRALFNLEKENEIFEKEGINAYRHYQVTHAGDPLEPGVAFPFIERLLSLNAYFPQVSEPFKVVVLSRNSPESGQRFFASCRYHRLPIKSGAFTSGHPTFPYIKAFGASLFLSANPSSVFEATRLGYPAGLVLPSKLKEDQDDGSLRIAFDFDGVLVDDESQKQFDEHGLEGFQSFEVKNATSPHNGGPLAELLKKIAYFQKIDLETRGHDNPHFNPVIRISIVTSRGAPGEQRLITTLKSWGLHAAELFLLDGLSKYRILEEIRPHIFFDDQMAHLRSTASAVPSVWIPFGVANEKLFKEENPDPTNA